MKTLRILSATAALGLFTAAAQPAGEQPPADPNAPAYGVPAEEIITNAPMQFGTNEVVSPEVPAADMGGMAVGIDPNTGLPVPLPDAPPEQPAPFVEPPRQSAPSVRRAAAPPPEPATEPMDASAYAPPATAGRNGTGDLRLNFRNAPIEMVLNYLSDAAGFIIQLDTAVSGRVDIWSNQPVTRQEAVELLNSVLNRKGYAVVRNGRILKIMTRDEALHSDIPVNVSNEPNTIPKTDELVTQIIPIRYVEAKQLVTDLSPLISTRATIIANEAGNSIIITDTQANIRHAMEIIKAIDTSAEDFSEVRVFHLRYHDPVEVANLLTSLFSDQGQGNQSPIRFGGGFGQGGGGGGGGGFGQGGGGGGGRFARIMAAANTNNRIRKRTRVVAVPDQRTASVVVTAAKDLMDQIGDMVEQIDRESPKVGRVSVIHLENADPQQLQQVLQDMFQTGNTARRGTLQNSPLMNRSQQGNQNQTTTGTGFGNQSFGGGGFGGGGGGGGFRPGGQ